jgi:hypothetical protein
VIEQWPIANVSQRLDFEAVGKRKFVEFGRDAFGPQWSDITGNHKIHV